MWIEGGWVPLPLTIERCEFFWDERRFNFFVRLLLRKGYQAELIPWEGYKGTILPHSLHTSLRKLSREMRIPRSTLHELLHWFADHGFIQMVTSRRSGLIIRIMTTDAFRPLEKRAPGHSPDTLSHRNKRKSKKTVIPARTDTGHDAGHLNSSERCDKTADIFEGTAWEPDTKPDTISPSFKSFINQKPKTLRKVDKSANRVDNSSAEYRKKLERLKSEDPDLYAIYLATQASAAAPVSDSESEGDLCRL